MNTNDLLDFHRRQLEAWPTAAANFKALDKVEMKRIEACGMTWVVQHNPARIRSTAAKVDRVSLAARPCFLCGANRPPEQMDMPLGNDYRLLVNPFPIFPLHFTIPATDHIPQLITSGGEQRFADMCRMAESFPGFALFYNGATCGASAPDHFHFQMVERESLPIFDRTEQCMKLPFRVETTVATDADNASAWFRDVCDTLATLPENHGEDEPRMNILCTAVAGKGIRIVVIPRRAHRPDFYGSGTGRMLLSPASVDLAGVIISPDPDDFRHKITPQAIGAMLSQTCYTTGS